MTNTKFPISPSTYLRSTLFLLRRTDSLSPSFEFYRPVRKQTCAFVFVLRFPHPRKSKTENLSNETPYITINNRAKMISTSLPVLSMVALVAAQSSTVSLYLPFADPQSLVASIAGSVMLSLHFTKAAGLIVGRTLQRHLMSSTVPSQGHLPYLLVLAQA